MTESVGHNAKEIIKSFVERVERLAEEKDGLASDIKDVYAEAKGGGFDTKALRRVVALRKQDREKLKEHQAILEIYLDALGMDWLL